MKKLILALLLLIPTATQADPFDWSLGLETTVGYQTVSLGPAFDVSEDRLSLSLGFYATRNTVTKNWNYAPSLTIRYNLISNE